MPCPKQFHPKINKSESGFGKKGVIFTFLLKIIFANDHFLSIYVWEFIIEGKTLFTHVKGYISSNMDWRIAPNAKKANFLIALKRHQITLSLSELYPVQVLYVNTIPLIIRYYIQLIYGNHFFYPFMYASGAFRVSQSWLSL